MACNRIFSIRMTEEQYKEAMEKATGNGIPLSELIKRLLSDDGNATTLRQLRIDVDNLRKDIQYLQYSLEMLMSAGTEFFEYLLLRIPSRDINGENGETPRETLRRLREENRRIAEECTRRSIQQILSFRGDERDSDDPFHTREFEKALLRKRTEHDERVPDSAPGTGGSQQSSP